MCQFTEIAMTGLKHLFSEGTFPRYPRTRLAKLQQSHTQLSERLAYLGNHGCPIVNATPETTQTSQYYGIKGFKEGQKLCRGTTASEIFAVARFWETRNAIIGQDVS